MNSVISTIVTAVVQRRYWFDAATSDVNVDANETDVPVYGARAAFFERAASNRNVGVKIRNLTKVLVTTCHIGTLNMSAVVLLKKMNCWIGN